MGTTANTVDTTRLINRFKWWWPVCAGIVSLVVGTLILISSAFDLWETAYLFLGIPLISVAVAISVFVAAKRSRRTPSLSIFLILPAYWAVTWILFAYRIDVRFKVRWVLGEKDYKSSMMKQPEPISGELRHMDWDGWGWAGMDTEVYLVYDPADTLAGPANTRSAGKFRGIPCEVPRVRRLESHWYAVEYYTGASWNECG